MKKVVNVILLVITALYVICICIFVGSSQHTANGMFVEINSDQQSTVSNAAITPDGKININVATVAELTYLSGIGEVLAQRIVEYREENGPFSQPADLLNVKGIGETKLNNIIHYIAVE
jgi:competence protein ComEA